ncbi:MAG: LuxR family transcriptional regulator [Nevskiaceae bacterium]|nr:MAG: LuxR family transcriptional regulator [Nevskiaceae bacterium]
MEVNAIPNVVDPVDQYIAKLYRSALAVPATEYRVWALRELGHLIGHDAGIWGSGSLSRLRFHTCTVAGLPDSYPAALEATTDINPILPRMLQNLDEPVDMRDVMRDSEFFDSEIYKRVFGPHGISRILATVHFDQRSGLYSLVSLYRRDRRHVFTADERARQKRITYHLFSAVSHAFFLHLARDRQRPLNSASAVVDQERCFHQAQPRFLDLLEQHFPGRNDPYTLPFDLPTPGETRVMGELCIRSEPYNDVFIIDIWPAGPLDRLTQREREIVLSVAQGLSFKQAAKKIGVAPSTVANHLYRVYRKLGVYSRTELAALVHPGARS